MISRARSYMSLLDSAVEVEENPFKLYEQKLLLLALTYRKYKLLVHFGITF